jgi:hypothetical protein
MVYVIKWRRSSRVQSLAQVYTVRRKRALEYCSGTINVASRGVLSATGCQRKEADTEKDVVLGYKLS